MSHMLPTGRLFSKQALSLLRSSTPGGGSKLQHLPRGQCRRDFVRQAMVGVEVKVGPRTYSTGPATVTAVAAGESATRIVSRLRPRSSGLGSSSSKSPDGGAQSAQRQLRSGVPLYQRQRQQQNHPWFGASSSLLSISNSTRNQLKTAGRTQSIIVIPGSHMNFHTTPRREGAPLIPLLAAVFKASASLEMARQAARIGFTFFPILLLTKHKGYRRIKIDEIMGKPPSEQRRAAIMRKIRISKRLLTLIFLVPWALFWATIIASMERTPLTGRWRLILLSPEEEDEIGLQLAGRGWYEAVTDILSQDGQPPRFIPTSDWRYQWVNDTLRRLESTIPILVRESELCPNWVEKGPDDRPMPPPAEYPLTPRPRAAEYLRCLCERMNNREAPPVPHAAMGPPYSLLIVDKPMANAFSYGFGPDGGGGIVVHSGFLDEIMSKHPPPPPPPPSSSPSSTNNGDDEKKTSTSWVAGLLGMIFSPFFSLGSSSPHSHSAYHSSHPAPTPAQTSELAVLLAHELAHLVLSHHLETLSSSTIILPGTLSILSDVVRVLIFPVTMIFGPFVNDAVAQIGKVGSGELLKIGEACTSVPQEIEADVVSARLLAHAGFDARDAVKFWEERGGRWGECASVEPALNHLDEERKRGAEEEEGEGKGGSVRGLARMIVSATHPVDEQRVERLKEELQRWEVERLKALKRRRELLVI